MRKMHLSTAGNLTLVLIAVQAAAPAWAADGDAIQPYRANPYYWQYKGKPVMLIGASDKDNLWQWTGTQLTEHLELMRSVGGNYVRNTMSDRNEGDLFAAKPLDDGRYDLELWNDAYWERLRFFLEETQKREIIVQLTLWDWFDLSGAGVYGRFAVHPLNPDNNVNWEPGTIRDAGDFYGGSLRRRNQPVLDYQHRYIDKLMSLALRHDHVLYNINNESSVGADWENYWASHIQEAAQRPGKEIHVTSMRFAPGTSVRHVMTYPEIYSFAEVSQNNQDALGPVGRKHWENLLFWRKMIALSDKGPMPIDNVKVSVRWLDIAALSWSAEEIVEPKWDQYDGTSWWGPQRILTLGPANHRSYIALIRVIE